MATLLIGLTTSWSTAAVTSIFGSGMPIAALEWGESRWQGGRLSKTGADEATVGASSACEDPERLRLCKRGDEETDVRGEVAEDESR